MRDKQIMEITRRIIILWKNRVKTIIHQEINQTDNMDRGNMTMTITIKIIDTNKNLLEETTRTMVIMIMMKKSLPTVIIEGMIVFKQIKKLLRAEGGTIESI